MTLNLLEPTALYKKSKISKSVKPLTELELIRILKNYDGSMKIIQSRVEEDQNKMNRMWSFDVLSREKIIEDIHFTGTDGMVFRIYQVE